MKSQGYAALAKIEDLRGKRYLCNKRRYGTINVTKEYYSIILTSYDESAISPRMISHITKRLNCAQFKVKQQYEKGI